MKKMLLVLLAMLMLLTACGPAATTDATSEPITAVTESTTEGVQPTTEDVVEPTAETVVEPTAETVVAEPKTLVIGFGTESYPRLGWTIDTDDAFSMSYIGVLETLVKVDYDGFMVPCLAESWTQVTDTTWQFTLRQGVTFTNGEPFNAAAVVNALNYIKNSPTPPRGITADTFLSIEATDDYTVVITTATFDALVPNRLTSPNTGILAPSAYTAASGPVNPFNTGTGPFILTNEIPDQSLTVVKNSNYWGGNVNLDEVTILYVPDVQIRAGMLQTGEIDIDIHVPVEQLPILAQDSSISILRMQTPRTTTLSLNMSRPPFNDLRMRQAVAYAIDREAIVIATLEGIATPGVGPISPPEAWVNPDLAGYPYNPDMARQLLAEAGYAEGELTVGLWTYPDRPYLPTSAVAIQGMLADVGINVEVRVAQYDPMIPDVTAGNFDMFLASRNHVLDNFDPEGFFSSDYTCTGSYNLNLFCDPQYDTLLAEARTLTDVEARYAIYRQLQSILVDEQCVGIYLNYTEIVDGVRSNVVNFRIHPLERYVLTADLDVTP
jgi:peptide/nickel transport system substrate-binding protein